MTRSATVLFTLISAAGGEESAFWDWWLITTSGVERFVYDTAVLHGQTFMCLAESRAAVHQTSCAESASWGRHTVT